SGIHLALLSLNCGTPEWDEMQALIASGMFQRARAGGHVIALHEGTLPDLDGHTGWTAPIDLWWGEGHTIPGAPDVDRAGALCFRYRYLQQLMAEAGCEVPIVITEFYTGYDLPGYAPIAGIEWYDNEAARDPLLLGFCPFTFGPTGSWKDQSCETYAAALIERIVALKDRVNGAPVEPEPEPEPPDNTLSITDLRGALMTNPASPWYPWARRTLSEITTLFVHHSAGVCSSDPQFVENIAAYHCAATGKNRPGICYAYVVGADGTVWQTSDLENVVFGQGSADSPGDENRYGVSVCLLGCFINGAEPTAAQLDSLERLIAHVEGLVGKSLRVWGHKDVINTQCPGDSWPFRPGWGLITTPLIGLHDEGLTQTGTEWLMALHKPALVVKPVYVRNYENGALDYSAAEAAGLRVLVSLRWSWSVDKGGAGTLPPRDTNEWNSFIAGAIQLIKSARGVWGWSIGNEVNNPREFPAWRDLTAADAAAAFNALAVACPGVRLAPAPLDPFNAQAGDPRDWLAGLWGALEHAPAFVDAHGYIHGPDRTLVGSDVKFTDAPLEWQYYNYP
ncbi:MAG: peptidoglycan recognition protein family protein, partial [Sphaerochaeta sp.]|nr:peptidoglycan recognition protein family protein [Sphaerochaeta sp.]